jgi:Spy/CpxP family protein refolding chaperone
MKNLILTAVIAFAFIAGVNAQGRFSAKDRIKEMKDSLALTDSQVAIIDSIYTSIGEKIKDITATGQDRRDAMRQIMTDTNAQIESILTPDQKDKFEKMMAERRSRMGNRPPDGDRPPDNGGTPPGNVN